MTETTEPTSHDATSHEAQPPQGGVFMLLARLGVGGMFIYLATMKIFGLPEFHKVMKTYDLLPIDPPWLLNGTAMYLPFLELVLGAAIIAGLWLRSSFAIVLGMMIFFTITVYSRGVEIQAEEGIAFTQVAFDCGCGTGVVQLWKKLIENGVLIALSLIGVVSSSRRFRFGSPIARFILMAIIVAVGPLVTRQITAWMPESESKPTTSVGAAVSTDPNGGPSTATTAEVAAPTPKPCSHPEKVIDEYGTPRIQGIQVVEYDDLRSYMDLGDDVCVVLDARKKPQYTEGHLPGAIYLDYYKLPELIDEVRPLLAVDFVVVYCNGGDCEDSIGLARDLVYEHAVPLENVWVYECGYEDWVSRQGEVVKGESPR